jgi:hypothetical protein
MIGFFRGFRRRYAIDAKNSANSKQTPPSPTTANVAPREFSPGPGFRIGTAIKKPANGNMMIAATSRRLRVRAIARAMAVNVGTSYVTSRTSASGRAKSRTGACYRW